MRFRLRLGFRGWGSGVRLQDFGFGVGGLGSGVYFRFGVWGSLATHEIEMLDVGVPNPDERHPAPCTSSPLLLSSLELSDTHVYEPSIRDLDSSHSVEFEGVAPPVFYGVT